MNVTYNLETDQTSSFHIKTYPRAHTIWCDLAQFPAAVSDSALLLSGLPCLTYTNHEVPLHYIPYMCMYIHIIYKMMHTGLQVNLVDPQG